MGCKSSNILIKKYKERLFGGKNYMKIEVKVLNSIRLTKLLIAASRWLSKYADVLNDLNVYPVPDGDTGTNMSMTLQSVENELIKMNHEPTMNELVEANRTMVSTKVTLMAVQKSTENIVGGICNAIVKAEQSNIKVGINDEGLAQLNERNTIAISAFKQALDEHEQRINALFVHQQTELKCIRDIEEGAYFNGRTYAWMFGLAFLGWAIIFVEITIWICIKLF